MLAAQLEIDLVAGIAQLTRDLGVAKSQVVGAMREINDAVDMTKKGLEALGITLSVGFAIDFVKSSIEATARMKELGVQTGTTAAAISRFDLPARSAGSSLDAVAQAITHMSKAATDAQDPASRSALALHAIGLSAAELKSMKPDEMFELVARRLGEYSNSIEKNAAEQQLLGRGGAEVNRVLANIAESSKLAATVTNEQAAEASKLTTEMLKLKMQSEELTRGVLTDTVPGLTRIVDAMKQARQESGLLAAAWVALGGAAAELMGLNDTDIQRFQKGLRDAQAQIVEFKGHIDVSRQAELLQGLVQPINMIESSFMRANAQARLLQETIDAYAGKYDDQASRAARQGQVLSPGQKPLNFDPSGGAGSALKAANELNDVLAKIDEKAAGFTADWAKDTTILAAALQTGQISVTQYATALGKLIALQPAYIKGQETINALAQHYVDLLRQQQQGQVAAVNAADDLINSLEDQGKALQGEIATMGMSDANRQKYLVDLQTETELRKVLADPNLSDAAAAMKQADILAERDKLKVLIDQKSAISDQLTLWNSVADAAGSFFSQLITSGQNAFDVIRNAAKQFLAELISIFMKRWVLQMVAGVTGSSALASSAGQVGQGTAGGAIIDYFTGSGMSSSNPSTGQYYQPGGAQDLQGTGFAPQPTAGQYATGAVGGAFMGYGIGAAANSMIGNSRNQVGMTAGGAVGGAVGYVAGAYLGAEYGSAFGPIGMVVGAIIGALIGSLIKSGGGPKQQAVFGGTYDSSGKLVSPVDGQALTEITGDNQQAAVAHGLTDNTALGYANAMHALGLKGGNMTFGMGLSTDPAGTAPGFVHGIVKDANGNTIFKQFDDNAPRDATQFQTESQLEVSRMILAAVKASDMPKYLAQIFDGVDAMTATQDQINALFQTAEALKSIYDLTSRDPLSDAATAFSDSMDQFDAALRNNGLTVRAVMDAYDGSANAATNLQQATEGYYNAQVQLLNQLTAAKQSIDAAFGDTFRGFKLAGMSDQQKYDFYQSEASSLEQQALASTDPAAIQRLVQQITQDEQAAFALLTPEQQAGAAGQSFITAGAAAQQAIDNHIDHITDAVATATKDTLSEIKTLIAGPTGSMNSAANTLNGAAHTIADSADKPLHVIVDNYNGGQEVTG